MDRINRINKIKGALVSVNPVNPVNSVVKRLASIALLLALAGCGIINWSISNSGDGCPPQKTYPCP